MADGWKYQLWETRTDGEYFKLCKTLREFPDKFGEYYRMNITTDPKYIHNQQKALQYLRCIQFAQFSPTCCGQYFGHFQGDVIITKIQTYKFG
jgi:hypothetical protein